MPLSIESPISRDGDVLLATKLGVVRRPSRAYPVGRICATPDCNTQLSIYNPDRHCSVHAPPQPEEVPDASRAA
jgi:hypothetical protein